MAAAPLDRWRAASPPFAAFFDALPYRGVAARVQRAEEARDQSLRRCRDAERRLRQQCEEAERAA
eukprot:gene31257-19310_t